MPLKKPATEGRLSTENSVFAPLRMGSKSSSEETLATDFFRVSFRSTVAFLRARMRSLLLDRAPRDKVLWWRFRLVVSLCPACQGCGSPLCPHTRGPVLISAIHACFFASKSAAEKFPEKSLAPVSSVMRSCTGCWGQVGNAGKIAGILRKQTLSESTDVIGKQNKWLLEKQTAFQCCWSSLKLAALHSLYSFGPVWQSMYRTGLQRWFCYSCWSNPFDFIF